MTEPETPTQPERLTRHDYRRRARILWNVAQIAVERAKEAEERAKEAEAALAEERTLRQKAESRAALLAERVQQLEAQLAYARHCGA